METEASTTTPLTSLQTKSARISSPDCARTALAPTSMPKPARIYNYPVTSPKSARTALPAWCCGAAGQGVLGECIQLQESVESPPQLHPARKCCPRSLLHRPSSVDPHAAQKARCKLSERNRSAEFFRGGCALALVYAPCPQPHPATQPGL